MSLHSVLSRSNSSSKALFVSGFEGLTCRWDIMTHESKWHWNFPWALECSCIDLSASQLVVTSPAAYFSLASELILSNESKSSEKGSQKDFK